LNINVHSYVSQHNVNYLIPTLNLLVLQI